MSDYRLTTSFPYLARRVGVRIGELFERRIARHGVTVSMYRVLAVLTENDSLRLGGLAGLVSIELSTLSRLIGAMTRKGLVSRVRPRGNARVVEISLTARGRALAAKLMPLAARCEAVAVAGLSPADVARLKSYLEAAYHNLDALEAELTADNSVDNGARGSKAGRETARSPA